MDTFATEFRAAVGGRTQEEVAALLGLDQATISRILKGERRLGKKTAQRIVRAFPALRCAVCTAVLDDLDLELSA